MLPSIKILFIHPFGEHLDDQGLESYGDLGLMTLAGSQNVKRDDYDPRPQETPI